MKRFAQPRVLAVLVMALSASCSLPTTPAPLAEDAQSQMPNPASVFCEANGGQLEIRTAPDGGQTGICVFVDGTECEEWSYFRGECIRPSLTFESLANAEYHSADWGTFQLRDGLFERPPDSPGESSSAYTTRLMDPAAFGDLNGDGISDAAVCIATQNGGTGHFVELAAVLNDGGSPRNVSTLSLGDRVVPEEIVIEVGTITLHIRTHGPGDALCCPSQLETWQYRLDGDRLVRLK